MMKIIIYDTKDNNIKEKRKRYEYNTEKRKCEYGEK